jgi:hypothetical protein
MNNENGQRLRSQESPESFGELLSELANHVTDLISDEMDLARQEMHKKLKILPVGMLMVAIGLVVGQAGFLTLCAAAVVGLAAFLGLETAIFIIGAGLVLIGGIVTFYGLQRFRWENLKPKKTIQTLKRGKEWLKELK